MKSPRLLPKRSAIQITSELCSNSLKDYCSKGGVIQKLPAEKVARRYACGPALPSFAVAEENAMIDFRYCLAEGTEAPLTEQTKEFTSGLRGAGGAIGSRSRLDWEV